MNAGSDVLNRVLLHTRSRSREQTLLASLTGKAVGKGLAFAGPSATRVFPLLRVVDLSKGNMDPQGLPNKKKKRDYVVQLAASHEGGDL